jgi:hypothetical protein
MIRNVRRPRSHLSPSFDNPNPVRDKLQQEIAELESRMDQAMRSADAENREAVLTFKEMIYSRSELLASLSRQKDERSLFGVDRKLQ